MFDQNALKAQMEKLYEPKQHNWKTDITYGIMKDPNLGFIHRPRPPGAGTVKVGCVDATYARTTPAAVSPQPVAQARGYAKNVPVLFTPTPGSVMEPARGFDPRVASSTQSSQYGHIAESIERKVVGPSPSVSAGEPAATPKARTKAPAIMIGYTQEQSMPLEQLGKINPNDDYRVRHRLTSCIVWDCGKGFMRTVAYDATPPWAQRDSGKTVPIPLSRAATTYTQVQTKESGLQTNRIIYQISVLVRSLPGQCWRLLNPAAFGDQRANIRQLAKSSGFIVVESYHIRERINAIVITHDTCHDHDNRSFNTALASQWQHIVEMEHRPKQEFQDLGGPLGGGILMFMMHVPPLGLKLSSYSKS